MKHEGHYVDLISASSFGQRIKMINVENIDPSAQQARTELGDITELMASIKEKGILEPILVRRKDGRYEIIAGERRFVAAKGLNMKEVACIEMEVSDNEAMEISLIENLQRKDLDVFEEAEGLKALSEIYGYDHQKIANKIGKARSTITEIINVSRIPKEVRDLCRVHGIKSRSTVIEISKQKHKDDMLKLISEIKARDLKREDTRELAKLIKGRKKKEKPFVYKYYEKDKNCKIRIEMKKAVVSNEELIEILEEVIKKLKLKEN